MKKASSWYLAPFLALAIVTLAAPPTFAATITVNTTAQSSASPTDCTLTQALIAANTDVAVNGCASGSGPDTIELPANQTLILAAAYDDPLNQNGLPPITSDVMIDGNGATIERQSAVAFGIFQVGTDSADLTEGQAGTLHVENLTIKNGFSSWSGGIYCVGFVGVSTLSLSNATISNNHTPGSGGGSSGGGIAAHFCNVTITNSTVRTNSVNENGGVFAVLGGGLYLDNSNTVISNSTVSGNILDGSYLNVDGHGGGIYVESGSLTLSDSTVSYNTRTDGTGEAIGGGLYNAGGDVTLSHSIISGNSADTGIEIYNDLESGGTIHGDNYNLIGVNGDAGSVNFTPSGTDIVPAGGVGIGAILAPLANNGGPTPTHALPLGSPAVDKVPSAACPATDQRGVARPVGSDCDIGSFERGFAFTGFFVPVDNPETYNYLKAGSAVPVKFQLGGNQGLNILASGSPTSQQIVCEANSPLDQVEVTVTAGGSSLSYDTATQTYTYVWKTNKAWGNSCREFKLTLTDGSEHTALFWFQK